MVETWPRIGFRAGSPTNYEVGNRKITVLQEMESDSASPHLLETFAASHWLWTLGIDSESAHQLVLCWALTFRVAGSCSNVLARANSHGATVCFSPLSAPTPYTSCRSCVVSFLLLFSSLFPRTGHDFRLFSLNTDSPKQKGRNGTSGGPSLETQRCKHETKGLNTPQGPYRTKTMHDWYATCPRPICMASSPCND